MLATELRLDGAEAAITADLHGDDVARATAEAQAIGINAIPAFLLDGRLIVLGAQPDEVFEQAFHQLARAGGPHLRQGVRRQRRPCGRAGRNAC